MLTTIIVTIVTVLGGIHNQAKYVVPAIMKLTFYWGARQ